MRRFHYLLVCKKLPLNKVSKELDLQKAENLTAHLASPIPETLQLDRCDWD